MLAIDHVLETCQLSRAVEGLLDELAHIATALALLAPLTLSTDRATTLGALAGAILLDADHVPGELGLRWITRGTGRPYPHTLLSALLLVGIGTVSQLRATLTGKLRVGGRKPWLASSFPRLFPPVPHGGVLR